MENIEFYYDNLFERQEKKSHRKKIVLAIAILVVLLFLFVYHAKIKNYFFTHFTSSFVKVEKLSNFDPKSYSIIVNKYFQGNFCDVYLSGPSRKVIYLGGWGCDELYTMGFRIPDLVAKFDHRGGNYVLFVVSDKNETYELEFTVLP